MGDTGRGTVSPLKHLLLGSKSLRPTYTPDVGGGPDPFQAGCRPADNVARDTGDRRRRPVLVRRLVKSSEIDGKRETKRF